MDDKEAITHCGHYPVVGNSEKAADIDSDIFVAVGNAQFRKTIMEKLFYKSFPVLIHPKAVVAQDVVVGKGTVVVAGAVINPGTSIGKGCIVNTTSSVGHDCCIGDYLHVALGAHICGHL